MYDSVVSTSSPGIKARTTEESLSTVRQIKNVQIGSLLDTGNSSRIGICKLTQKDTVSPSFLMKPLCSYYLPCLCKGRFGNVYGGIWDGTEVALKQLKDTEDISEFKRETVMLV